MSSLSNLPHMLLALATRLSFAMLMRDLLLLSLLVALVSLFKPLLSGLARALVLAVKPRLSSEERAGRRKMRDALMLQSMLDNVETRAPSHAAELRALASRA